MLEKLLSKCSINFGIIMRKHGSNFILDTDFVEIIKKYIENIDVYQYRYWKFFDIDTTRPPATSAPCSMFAVLPQAECKNYSMNLIVMVVHNWRPSGMVWELQSRRVSVTRIFLCEWRHLKTYAESLSCGVS